MESEEKITFINEYEESQSFLQNLNVFNKQQNSKKIILKILFFYLLLQLHYIRTQLKQDIIIYFMTIIV